MIFEDGEEQREKRETKMYVYSNARFRTTSTVLPCQIPVRQGANQSQPLKNLVNIRPLIIAKSGFNRDLLV
jgi:hypothetical protein